MTNVREDFAKKVSIRYDKSSRSVEKLKFDFMEELANYAPPCIIQHTNGPKPINLRKEYIKIVREFHSEHSGEPETIALFINIMDRLFNNTNPRNIPAEAVLVSCYSLASNLHDVIPIDLEAFCDYLHNSELVQSNLDNSLIIMSDLHYNIRGFTPLDFVRTFVIHLCTLNDFNYAATLTDTPNSSSCTSSLGKTPFRTVGKYTSPTPPTKTHVTPSPSMSSSSVLGNANNSFIVDVTLVRHKDDIIKMSVNNYNQSLHSSKLAMFHASEIAAACIIRVVNSLIVESNKFLSPSLFIRRVPLLANHHSPPLWQENVLKALRIVSKYSCTAMPSACSQSK